MRELTIAVLILASLAAEARGEPVKSLRLLLPPQPNPVVDNVGHVFTRQVESRCDARVVVQSEAPLTKVQNLKEADDAWTLAQAIDGRLPAWAKTSWRWRVLYIRAAIDHVLKSDGVSSSKGQAAFKPLVDELERIYRVTPATNYGVRPVPFPKP
jgi:hypothetical protein